MRTNIGTLAPETVEMEPIPDQFLGSPPRDLTARIEYLRFHVGHVQRSKIFTSQEKFRLLRTMGRQLERTEIALRNQHECACCGITLRVSALVGPECAKHPDKFPCNAHRRGRTAI